MLVSASVCSPRIWFKCTFVQHAAFLAHVHTGDRADSEEEPEQGWSCSRSLPVQRDLDAVEQDEPTREDPHKSDASHFLCMSSKFPGSLSRPRWDIFLEALAKMKDAQL